MRERESIYFYYYLLVVELFKIFLLYKLMCFTDFLSMQITVIYSYAQLLHSVVIPLLPPVPFYSPSN